MEQETRDRIASSAREYVAAYANVEQRERRITLLELELDKLNEELAAYSRDEDDAAHSLELIWAGFDDESDMEEFRKITAPFIERIDGMRMFGDE